MNLVYLTVLHMVCVDYILLAITSATTSHGTCGLHLLAITGATTSHGICGLEKKAQFSSIVACI